MKKPIIGITASMMKNENGNFAGYEKNYVSKDYVESIVQNGGIPVIFPIHEDIEVIKEQMSMIDGVLFTGGHDVYPLHYGEEPSPKCGETFPERDVFEYELLRCAMEQKKPILGICRGIQMINTYFGGTLYQDISEVGAVVCKHDQETKPCLATHTVSVLEASRLYNIIEEREIVVNSFHHQAVKNVGDGLKVTARAKDGVIEAVEIDNDNFLIAVQWHPEMMYQNSLIANKLFAAFVKESAKQKN